MSDTPINEPNRYVKGLEARIRELEAQLEEVDRNAKRLEALVEKVVAWDGKPTTHVIVPVKSTEAMNKAAHEAYCDALTNREAVSVSELISVVYAAMIRAAQEQ